MVKNTIKKMHGLNKIQTLQVSYNSPMVNSYTGGAILNALYVVKCPGSSFQLQDHIPQFNDLADNAQIYMKRCLVTTTMYNQGQLPCWVQILKLWVRNTIPNDYGSGTGEAKEASTVASIMQVDAPFVALPGGVSCTTGNLFQKNFKILSNKVRLFKPDSFMRISTKQRFGNKPLTFEQNANVNRSTFMKGTNLTFIRVWGVSYHDPVEVVDQTTPYVVSLYDHYYYSYYLMDDITPGSTLPATYIPNNRIGASNDMYLPSHTFATIPADFAYPQQVTIGNVPGDPIIVSTV